MAGHSKWANIKHRKSAQDENRGKIFQKLSKEITVAVVSGGPNPSQNSALRLAISKARSHSMPKSSIEKAISVGEGTNKNLQNFKEVFQFGNIQNGIGVVVFCLSDNLKRLTANVQAIFKKYGGGIGNPSSMNSIFERVGLIQLELEEEHHEDLTLFLLENDAKNLTVEQNLFTIFVEPNQVLKFKDSIEEKFPSATFEKIEVTFLPKHKVQIIDKEREEKFLKFIEDLENDNDVQEVFHNADFVEEPDET